MGKKGKNKNSGAAPKVEKPAEEKPAEEKQAEVKPVVAEAKKDTPVQPKVEELKAPAAPASETNSATEPAKVNDPALENKEDNDEESSKSKKKKNKKNQNSPADLEAETIVKVEPKVASKPDDNSASKPEPVKTEPEIEQKHVEISKVEEVQNEVNEGNSETLKKKRKRNKKKPNAANETGKEETTEEKDVKEMPAVPVVHEKQETDENGIESATGTLKKRNRNKNKNKNKKSEGESEVVEAVPEEPSKSNERVEAPLETPKAEPRKKNNNKKRGDSKRSILDELQERQEREQQEARVQLQNEIVRREKLLEKIDMVLDCKRSEAKVATDLHDSLKDITLLSSQASKSSSVQVPEDDLLLDKIEQVLGVTKLEIKNVQHQQAFVGRLEAELAKVKNTKDKFLRGETEEASTSAAPALPEHIEKMTRKIKDVKELKPKKKEDLLKEIESRDVLMEEINKVLDTTKNEIEKVQKQQKIIANLETELHKIKQTEIGEKLAEISLEDEEEPESLVPVSKAPSASASLLDALMANVGKLKEAQALKKLQETPNAPEHIETPKEQEKTSSIVVEKQKTVEISPSIVKSTVAEIKVKQPEPIKEEFVESNPSVKQEKPKDERKQQDNKASKDPKNQNKVEAAPEKTAEKVAEKPAEKSVVKVEDLKKNPSVNKNEKPVEKPATLKPDPKQEKSNEAQKRDDTKTETVSKKPKVVEPLNEETKEEAKVEVAPKTEEKALEENSEPQKAVELENVEKSKNQTTKGSPKGSPKNKNQSKKNANKKPESPKAEPKQPAPVAVIGAPAPVETSAWSKPSMAEMLKNAPDPQPGEFIAPLEKLAETTELIAPLALPESDLKDVKPIVEKVEKSNVEVAPLNIEAASVAAVDEPKKEEKAPALQDVSLEACRMVDGMVFVEKSDVETANEEEPKEKTSSKNVQGSGFASLAEKQDVKPLRKDEKATPGKSKSPVKNSTTTRAQLNKPTATLKSKPSPPKTAEVKKPVAKPVIQNNVSAVEKPSSTVTEASSTKPLIETTSTANSQSKSPAPSTPEKPKIAPKPEIIKAGSKTSSPSPSRTPQKTGNVAPSSAPKSKTPSPVKPPVSKSATTPPQTSTAKPKPSVAARPTAAKPTTPATNTKQKTNTPKTNGVKPATSKATPASSAAANGSK